MTALRAKLYEPEPAKKPARRLEALVRSLLPGAENVNWSEAAPGKAGVDIGRVYFEALQRDLNTATDDGGGYLKKTTQPTAYFDAMLAEAVIGRAGAKVENPRGDWSAIPVVTDAGELTWVDPNAPPTIEASMSFGSRSRRPHQGIFVVDVSRVLRVTAGGLAERVVLQTGAKVLAAGLDSACLAGTGADGQPLGILNTPDLPSTSGAAFSTTVAAELIRMVEAADGTPTAVLVSPATAKILRTRPRFTDTDTPILSGGKVADLPCFVTTAMPDDKLLLGDFRRLTVYPEAIEVMVNPYAQSVTGVLELSFNLFVDVVAEHAAAFAVATSVS